MSSIVDGIFARARELGEASSDAAIDGGEYEAYERAGRDSSDLPGTTWFEQGEPALKKEVAVLTPAQRAELPDDDELWELLANEWFESYEERAAQRRR